MVNTGRPSPACKACRARRLKCDQTKPACIKCIKAKRVCPGYREPFEVNFRDQTQSTIRKHQRLNAGSAKSPESDRSRDDDRPSSSSSEEDGSPRARPVIKFEPGRKTDLYAPQKSTLEILNLQTPVEVQATCFFVSNFIAVQAMHLNGGMRFLDPLISSAREGSPFHSTLLATSMASLASRPNAGALIPLARVYYNKALRQVAKVVQDKEKSKDDESLGSIILLILYEALMWEEQSQRSLKFHIQGAQAIVKCRGPEQRHRPIGYAMFEFIRAFMVHQYVHSPDYDANEIKWWASEGSTDDSRHVLQRLNVEATLLRRQLGTFMADKSDDSSIKSPVAFRIYRKAKKLDKQLAEWFESMDVVCQRTILRWQDDNVLDELIHRALAYPGKVYTFKNIWIASKFLNARTHRLILAEIMAQIADWIQRHCQAEALQLQFEREEAECLAREQVREVISMIPYFCSWPRPDAPSPYGGMTCCFQLYVAASTPFITRRQKRFVVGRLSHINQASGLKLAGKFAEKLVQRLRSSAFDLDDTLQMNRPRIETLRDSAYG